MRVNLQTRILAPLFVVGLLVILTFFFVFQMMNRVQLAQEMETLLDRVNELQINVQNTILTQDANYAVATARNSERILFGLRELEDVSAEQLQEMEQGFVRFFAQWTAIQSMFLERRMDEAQSQLELLEEGFEDLELVRYIEELQHENQEGIQFVRKAIFANMAIMIGAGLVYALVLIPWLVARPMRFMAKRSQAIAQGDLGERINIERGDEIGDLAKALDYVQDNIQAMIKESREVSARIRTGRLMERLPAKRFSGEYAELLQDINQLTDELSGYLDYVPTPLQVIDEDFNILYMNRAGMDLCELEIDKILGKKCRDIFKTSHCNTDYCACDQAMQRGAQMSAEANAYPAGERIQVSYTGVPIRDGSGRVVGAMEFMVDQSKIKQAQHRMLEVAESATEVADRLSSAAEELSAQVEQSSRGAQEQKSRADETATAMEEMNSTVLEVARNASSAAKQSDSAKEKAQTGAMVVGKAVDAINQVHEQASKMKSGLDDLGGQAEQIGKIMTVIEDIADQTNLLALNAAIEAARAGDAGRGFAVVADEVRKLAEKTMNATKEVDQSITSIQENTRTNIQGMDQSMEVISKATSLANDSGEALQDIVQMVEQAADQVRAIATATEEQSASSEEVNRSIEDINRISAETSDVMQQSASAISDLSQLAQEMQKLITKLRES